jgi:hypothetical protein
MTKQTTGKTGRKRIDNIEHFNIDPTSLLDDNPRQEKKPKNVISIFTTNRLGAQNVLFQIAMQTMRITKHCMEDLTFLTC